MPYSKPQALPAATAGSFNTFKVRKQTNKSISKRGRAKFDPQRRLEVQDVRHKRACLRCSLLKAKCSADDICTTCKQLCFVIHAHERKTLSFSGCIRTRLHEVSIFEFFIPAHDQQHLVIDKSQNLLSSRIMLGFESEVIWDLDFIVSDIVDWLDNPMATKISKVGILSSSQFFELVKPSVQEDTGVDFRRMIFAITLAYTQPTSSDQNSLTIPELYQVTSMAGHKFLRSLDEKLKAQSLKNCSHDDLQALFLLVAGTILAVGYAELVANDTALSSAEISGKLKRQSGQFQTMRDHLCQILAHYLLFLGAQLKLPIPTDADQFILKTAHSRWNKEGFFQWNIHLENETSFSTEDWVIEEFHTIDSGGSYAAAEPYSRVPNHPQPYLSLDSNTALEAQSKQQSTDSSTYSKTKRETLAEPNSSITTADDSLDISIDVDYNTNYMFAMSHSYCYRDAGSTGNAFLPPSLLLNQDNSTIPMLVSELHHLEDLHLNKNLLGEGEEPILEQPNWQSSISANLLDIGGYVCDLPAALLQRSNSFFKSASSVQELGLLSTMIPAIDDSIQCTSSEELDAETYRPGFRESYMCPNQQQEYARNCKRKISYSCPYVKNDKKYHKNHSKSYLGCSTFLAKTNHHENTLLPDTYLKGNNSVSLGELIPCNSCGSREGIGVQRYLV